MKILAELPGNGKMSTHLMEHHKEFSTKSPSTEGEMTPVASTVNCLPNLYSLCPSYSTGVGRPQLPDRVRRTHFRIGRLSEMQV